MLKFSLFSVLDFYKDERRSVKELYEQVLDQIVYAEELGFDAYWVAEHHFYREPDHFLACPNPAVLLAAAAPRTSRIGLNTAIANLAVRHPLQLAEDYAMLDILSNGRLGFGIGRGSYPHEYAGFGQSREESKGRFEEAWQIIRAAWQGERVNFEGRYYRVENTALNVLPVQKPLPRYWIATLSRESFGAWGRAGQPVINIPSLTADSFETLAGLVQEYRAAFLASGRSSEDFELPLVFHTLLAPTRAEAHRLAQTALARFGHQNSNQPGHHATQDLYRRKQLFVGTPAEVVDLIRQYQAVTGSRHFVFWADFGGLEPGPVRQTLELLAKEVLPQFTNI